MGLATQAGLQEASDLLRRQEVALPEGGVVLRGRVAEDGHLARTRRVLRELEEGNGCVSVAVPWK